MDSSSAQLHHHQDMSSQTLESMLVCTKTSAQQENKKPRPAEQALKCPRCDSTNTKFCYYNNYSLTQPRYFCKSCRRYWTKGGTLRNVPVGGGCRKNKRSSSSSSSSSLSKRGHDHQTICGTTSTTCTNPLLLSSVFTSNSTTTTTQPPLSYDHSDHLSLAIARLQKQTSGGLHHQQGFDQILGSGGGTTTSPSTTNNPSSTSTSCFDILGGFLESCTNTSTSTGLQSLYYGLNNINGGGLGIHNHPGVLPYEDHHLEEGVSTGLKQEMLCNVGSTRDIGDQISSSSNNNNRVLWGFPWQFNGGHDQGNLGDFHESSSAGGRQNWNGFGSTSSSSSWHGLLNSPLM